MHKSEVSRKYFKKLFTTFLCSSIIPLILCILAILWINYKMTVDEYNQKANLITKSVSHKYENIMEEYSNILLSLSKEEIIQDALINNDKELLAQSKPIIESLLTGRKEKIEIHIIDYDTSITYDTNIRAHLYDQSIYSEWGILYEMKNSTSKIINFPSNYDIGEDKKISQSMGKAIVDNENKIIGYVILDVYRSALLDQIYFVDGEEIEYVLLNNNNIIILDTTSYFKEGYHVLPQEIIKWNYPKLNIFNNKEDETIYVVNQEKRQDFSIFAFVKVRNFYQGISLLIRISLIIVTLVFFICLILVRIQVKKLYDPIEVVVNAMQKIAEGDIQVRIKEDIKQDDEMTMVAKGFNKMLDQIDVLLDEVVEQTERQKNAEIKELQAQINPHFLYNMLNEIKALAKLGRTEEISIFVISLAKLLRRSISNQEKYVTLKEDLTFVEDYLNLQKIRYENNFEVMIDIDESILDCKIPNLIIQPIIENSILHGMDMGENKLLIEVTGYIDDKGRVVLEIYDNGVGIDEEYMKYINDIGKSSSLYGGLGLENVQKRLLLRYGSEYGITIESKKNSYTKVVMILPYKIDVLSSL